MDLAGMKSRTELAVLKIQVRLPQERYPDWIAPHNGVQQPQHLLFRPHKIPLDRRQHNLFVLDLIE